MTCNLEIPLRTHQSDNSPPEYITIPEGTYDVQILSSEDAPSASFTLTGTIGCEEESKRDISLEVNIIGHRMSNEELFSVISWENPSIISLTPKYEGDGEVTYSIALEGATSRIASAQTPATLSPGDPIVLDVDPMGLLELSLIHI